MTRSLHTLTLVGAASLGLLLARPGTLSAQNLYVSNGGSSYIEQITPGGVASTFASSGLNGPTGVAFDQTGNLYVDNFNSNAIDKFTPGGQGSVFATGIGSSGAIAFDAAGNLYGADYGGSSIDKVTPGGTASVFATGGFLNQPFGLAFDAAGNLFVTSIGNNSIEKITPGGVASVFANSGSGLNQPTALAFDLAGNLFVSNQGNSTIQEFTVGGLASTFATSGLNGPRGLAFDLTGNLYVANTGNSTIEEFTPGGQGSVFVNHGLDSPEFLAFNNVSLPIPEPSTWALLLGGAVLLAWGRFRRLLVQLTSARHALALTVVIGFVSLLASARPAAAQSISSAYTLAGPTDTLTAQFDSSAGFTTTDLFSGPVEIQVTGTGHAFYDDTSDAFYFTATQTECVAGFPGSPNNGMFELAVGTPQHPFPYTSDPSSDAIKYDITFINGVGPVASGTIPAYSSTNTYDFVINVPNSTATALTFGVDDNNFGDNGGQYNLKVIQLSAIPEPATWALLLGGAGLLVATLRRRRARLASGALAALFLAGGMASAQAATPIALTSSQFSGTSASFSGDAFGGNPPPYGYTNNTNDSGWIWNPNDYFTVNFNAPTEVNEFRVWSVYTGGQRGANWEVFGSSDGTTFAPVTTFTYAIYNGGGVNADGSSRTDTAGWYEFDFNAANVAYQYWKIEDVSTTNDHSPRSAQVEFYGSAVPEPSAWGIMLGGAGLLVFGQRFGRTRPV